MNWGSLFGYEEAAPLPAKEEEEPISDEAFECDYEADCTPLYRALENAIELEEFAPIVKFLDTGYWSGSFFADSIAPAVQVKTWVTRFDPEDSSKVKWSQLPLHLAIVCGAPPSIIGRLVKMYPQALRCTDDQHMLPLHLALRHGADDEVVAYLLMHFPDAVNAKGKNGRTAIDCALRAKDKLRGKILEIFVEKTRGRKSHKEVRQLKADLNSKNDAYDTLQQQVDSMMNKLEEMKKLNSTVEQDLLKKIQELEEQKAEIERDAAAKLDRLDSEKMLENLELQKKLDILEDKLTEKEALETNMREEEEALRLELDAIEQRVRKSKSPKDWQKLKTEVEKLQGYRLEKTRSHTKGRIEALKQDLERTIQESDSLMTSTSKESQDLRTEILSVKSAISQLEKHDLSNKNEEELAKLRNEVDTLRSELKERTEASKTKVELAVLKKAMEIELRNAAGKTNDELQALKAAIKATELNAIEKKTNAELADMKTELENLKREMKGRKLLSSTQKDLTELRMNLSSDLAPSSAISEDDIVAMKQKSEQLEATLMQCASGDDKVISVKREIESMKDDFKKKEVSNKILSEVALLKQGIEDELKKSEGMTQQELVQLKKQMKNMTEAEIESKDLEELHAVKDELANLRNGLKALEMATETKQELKELKQSLAGEIKDNSGKTEQTLAMMKKAIDEVGMEQKEGKSLKKNLTEEIKSANEKTEKELLKFKKALDAIDVKKLESKNEEEWNAIRGEMEKMKSELAQQSKKSLDEELANIKKSIEAINLDKIRSNNDNEFGAIRQELDDMRSDLKQHDENEANLKSQIETLKLKDAKLSEKKRGLKKFFSRHFSKKGPTYSVASTITGKEDQAVTTISPPSVFGGMNADVVDSDEETSNTPATNERMLAQLSQSFEHHDVEEKKNVDEQQSVEVETVVSEQASTVAVAN